MTKKEAGRGKEDDLRKRAENAVLMPDIIKTLSPDEVRQTLHELQVHRVELEMQNEELRRTQEELEASLERYFDLYDLAPVGYFTLSDKGLILEANLKVAKLLDIKRSALVKMPLSRFILPEAMITTTGTSRRSLRRTDRGSANCIWHVMAVLNSGCDWRQPPSRAVTVILYAVPQ